MKTAFLAIGNELLTGKIQDLNGVTLAKLLRKYHLELNLIQIIGDDVAELTRTIKKLWSEEYCIILSGGLGPTLDDVTKDCLSQALEKPMAESASTLEMVEEIYQSKNRTYEAEKMHYHFIPQDFTNKFNRVGFAPGLYFEQNNQYLLALPGVPLEFESMIQDFFAEKFTHEQNHHKVFKETFSVHTMKLPESKIFNDLSPSLWKEISQLGTPFSLPHHGWVEIGAYLQENSAEKLEQSKSKLKQLILQTPFAESIWQVGHLSPAEYIVQYLSEKKQTICFIESCSGGLVSHLVTKVPGASKILKGSLISYTNEVKKNLLQVPQESIERESEVSATVAESMTKGGIKMFQTDFAASITGIAGPSSNEHKTPVGTAFINIRHSSGNVFTEEVHLRGTREKNINYFSQRVLLNCIEFMHNLNKKKITY